MADELPQMVPARDESDAESIRIQALYDDYYHCLDLDDRDREHNDIDHNEFDAPYANDSDDICGCSG